MTDPDGPQHAHGLARLARRWIAKTTECVRRPETRSWVCSPSGVRNRARLASLRDRWAGRRCFVVGNGPSLNDQDLSLIGDDLVIGTNRIVLHEAWGQWRSRMYTCVNPHLIEQTIEQIAGVGCPAFLPWEARRELPRVHDVYWLRTVHAPAFSYDLCDRIWQGATVTYVALQIAFFLGCREVILIGVDHHYERSGESNRLAVAEGPDPDHFTPSYFGEGFRWQLPDLAQSEIAYRLARHAFEQEGRRVVNATAGGRLEVFPRARYEDLF
ncbi:MAG: hypothetical protein AAGB48_02550 [Planctomycetota bacterium]